MHCCWSLLPNYIIICCKWWTNLRLQALRLSCMQCNTLQDPCPQHKNNENLKSHPNTGWHKKRELLKNPTKIEEVQEKKFIDRNWTIKTCLLRDSNPNINVWKLRPVDGVLLHIHILSLPLRISKVPILLHALQNATESHSAEHATHTGRHKRTGTFEMRSGRERMHTWRRTPSTGPNFQTLIIWITVS